MNTTLIRCLAALTLAGVTIACIDPFPTGPSQEGQCGFWGDTHPCVDLAIDPSPANILQGDTLRLHVWSDKSPFAPTMATWTVSGAAAAFVEGEATVKDVTTATSDVLVKGLTSGYGLVEARSTSGGYWAQRTVIVADSAALTSLQIIEPPLSSLSVKVGNYFPLFAELKDAAGSKYPAGVTWSTSDAGVVAGVKGVLTGLRSAGRANAVGSADVIVSFRGLRDTVRINVIP